MCQRIFDRTLQMSMRTFNGAVFVRHASIVACRLHPVVLAQLAITLAHHIPTSPADRRRKHQPPSLTTQKSLHSSLQGNRLPHHPQLRIMNTKLATLSVTRCAGPERDPGSRETDNKAQRRDPALKHQGPRGITNPAEGVMTFSGCCLNNPIRRKHEPQPNQPSGNDRFHRR